MHGPYHRDESPTQTRGDAEQIVATGELWGLPRRGGLTPQVKAYAGALKTGQRGIEFMTPVPPDKGSVPGKPVWSFGQPGVLSRQKQGCDFAAIPVKVTRNAQK